MDLMLSVSTKFTMYTSRYFSSFKPLSFVKFVSFFIQTFYRYARSYYMAYDSNTVELRHREQVLSV